MLVGRGSVLRRYQVNRLAAIMNLGRIHGYPCFVFGSDVIFLLMLKEKFCQPTDKATSGQTNRPTKRVIKLRTIDLKNPERYIWANGQRRVLA